MGIPETTNLAPVILPAALETNWGFVMRGARHAPLSTCYRLTKSWREMGRSEGASHVSGSFSAGASILNVRRSRLSPGDRLYLLSTPSLSRKDRPQCVIRKQTLRGVKG